MLSDEHTECAQCGMVCAPGEYHPYAACLMFMACKDGSVVRANLAEVRKQDEQLILQMREALERCTKHGDEDYAALAAGNARLEGA